MNTCDRYQELISRMLDDELNRQERNVLAEHLSTCDSCAAMYRAFAMVSESISADLVEAPEELSEDIMARIHRAEIRRRSARRNTVRPMKNLVAAAACVAILLTAVGGIAVVSSNRRESAIYESRLGRDTATGNTGNADLHGVSVLPQTAEETAPVQQQTAPTAEVTYPAPVETWSPQVVPTPNTMPVQPTAAPIPYPQATPVIPPFTAGNTTLPAETPENGVTVLPPVTVAIPAATATPLPTPEVYLTPAPEAVQEPVPEAVQVPVPEVYQEPVPEVYQEPVPEVYQEPAPAAIQEPVPEVVQEPIPEVVQEPAPEVYQEPIPEVVQEPAPSAIQESVPEVVQEPVPEEYQGFAQEWVQEFAPETTQEFALEEYRESLPEEYREAAPEGKREQASRAADFFAQASVVERDLSQTDCGVLLAALFGLPAQGGEAAFTEGDWYGLLAGTTDTGYEEQYSSLLEFLVGRQLVTACELPDTAASHIEVLQLTLMKQPFTVQVAFCGERMYFVDYTGNGELLCAAIPLGGSEYAAILQTMTTLIADDPEGAVVPEYSEMQEMPAESAGMTEFAE